MDELQFNERMNRLCAQWREVGYHANYFQRMLEEHGGLETARRLLNDQRIQDGFTNLILMGYRNLTMEHVIVDEHWDALFTEEQMNVARQRVGG